MRTIVSLLLAGLVLGPAAATLADAMPLCPAQPLHTYAGPLGAFAVGSTITGVHYKAGEVTVWDTNVGPCDANTLNDPDFDGDYDAGIGGGFFGWGPWANEPVCNYGLNVHGPDVWVHDVVWGPHVAFEVGANDMDGPVVTVDAITGATTCETDGVIAPGDPATSPTADADDCLAGIYVSLGRTCGGGGDGGYWVILDVHFLHDDNGLHASNPGTLGTILAGWFGAPYVQYTGTAVVTVTRA